MDKVIIFGIGDFAQTAHYFLSHDDKFDVIAFCLDEEYLIQDTFCGLKVVGFDKIEEIYNPNEYKMFVAVGYSKINRIREEIFLRVEKKKYSFISYISPDITIPDMVEIGRNCFILEGVVIMPFVKIMDNCIIWSGTHVGSKVVIKNNCFISLKVGIGASTVIEKNCFIGLNSTIRNKLTIARYSVIGAGAVILTDTEENQVYKAIETDSLGVSSKDLKEI